ncbi:hypothetical protein AB832_03695 [Flavobacteriaceae bacterium (ex Bugula neritina AB1)]|nr:hypothetical protein AB832_03695 [Flavobacteriaceae bacterium (ex Bugula neritina AB1)]
MVSSEIIFDKEYDKMTQKLIFLVTFLLFSILIFSQEKYIEKYGNGKLKIEGFIVNNMLDSIYKEYYQTGEIKIEGLFKNCQYETNHTKKYKLGCGVGNSNAIKKGKRHGIWKHYFKNGNIKWISNYHYDFRQGNFYSYYENGRLESVEFYTADDLKTSQYYNENGILEQNSIYSYLYSKEEERYLKSTKEFEYYEDGKMKIEREIMEKENDLELENYKEYYRDGFLKIEKQLEDYDKNGIYREYYENGNTRYEGIFKNDKPIDQQYFYDWEGNLIKIEHWKNEQLVKTEVK